MAIENLHSSPETPETKKPVNARRFAGFFMLIGLIVLLIGFYYSGRLKVAEGTVHDQMGNAIEAKSSSVVCQSEFFISKSSSKDNFKQRQIVELINLFPTVKSGEKLSVILCNGDISKIIYSNFNQFYMLKKRNKNVYLYNRKSADKNHKLGQVLKVVLSNEKI